MFPPGSYGQNGDVIVLTNDKVYDAAKTIKRIAKQEMMKGSGVVWPTDEETKEYLGGVR
jgi:hypothetical protein